VTSNATPNEKEGPPQTIRGTSIRAMSDLRDKFDDLEGHRKKKNAKV
jgi:hypothetical protein